MTYEHAPFRATQKSPHSDSSRKARLRLLSLPHSKHPEERKCGLAGTRVVRSNCEEFPYYEDRRHDAQHTLPTFVHDRNYHVRHLFAMKFSATIFSSDGLGE